MGLFCAEICKAKNIQSSTTNGKFFRVWEKETLPRSIWPEASRTKRKSLRSSSSKKSFCKETPSQLSLLNRRSKFCRDSTIKTSSTSSDGAQTEWSSSHPVGKLKTWFT